MREGVGLGGQEGKGDRGVRWDGEGMQPGVAAGKGRGKKAVGERKGVPGLRGQPGTYSQAGAGSTWESPAEEGGARGWPPQNDCPLGPPDTGGSGTLPSPASPVLPCLPRRVSLSFSPSLPSLSPRLMPREARRSAASPPTSPAAASPGGTRRDRGRGRGVGGSGGASPSPPREELEGPGSVGPARGGSRLPQPSPGVSGALEPGGEGEIKPEGWEGVNKGRLQPLDGGKKNKKWGNLPMACACELLLIQRFDRNSFGRREQM